MKAIHIRHEKATAEGEPEGSPATPEQTCVWVVGDNGTEATAYVKPGEKVSVELHGEIVDGRALPVAALGEVAEGW